MKNSKAAFNAEMQAQYDALVKKYWPLFEEAAEMNKKAKAMLKPYKGKNGLPQTGDEFFKIFNESQSLMTRARKKSTEAQRKVDAEFWG